MSGSQTFNWTGVDADEPITLVRAMIGDTDPNDPLFDDATIEQILSVNESPTLAAAALADMAAAKYIRLSVSKTIGRTKVDFSKIAGTYSKLADKLRALGPGDIPGGSGANAGGILAGGIRRSEFREERSQTEFQPYSFEVGQDDIPGGPDDLRDDDPFCDR